MRSSCRVDACVHAGENRVLMGTRKAGRSERFLPSGLTGVGIPAPLLGLYPNALVQAEQPALFLSEARKLAPTEPLVPPFVRDLLDLDGSVHAPEMALPWTSLAWMIDDPLEAEP